MSEDYKPGEGYENDRSPEGYKVGKILLNDKSNDILNYIINIFNPSVSLIKSNKINFIISTVIKIIDISFPSSWSSYLEANILKKESIYIEINNSTTMKGRSKLIDIPCHSSIFLNEKCIFSSRVEIKIQYKVGYYYDNLPAKEGTARYQPIQNADLLPDGVWVLYGEVYTENIKYSYVTDTSIPYPHPDGITHAPVVTSNSYTIIIYPADQYSTYFNVKIFDVDPSRFRRQEPKNPIKKQKINFLQHPGQFIDQMALHAGTIYVTENSPPLNGSIRYIRVRDFGDNYYDDQVTLDVDLTPEFDTNSISIGYEGNTLEGSNKRTATGPNTNFVVNFKADDFEYKPNDPEYVNPLKYIILKGNNNLPITSEESFTSGIPVSISLPSSLLTNLPNRVETQNIKIKIWDEHSSATTTSLPVYIDSKPPLFYMTNSTLVAGTFSTKTYPLTFRHNKKVEYYITSQEWDKNLSTLPAITIKSGVLPYDPTKDTGIGAARGNTTKVIIEDTGGTHGVTRYAYALDSSAYNVGTKIATAYDFYTIKMDMPPSFVTNPIVDYGNGYLGIGPNNPDCYVKLTVLDDDYSSTSTQTREGKSESITSKLKAQIGYVLNNDRIITSGNLINNQLSSVKVNYLPVQTANRSQYNVWITDGTNTVKHPNFINIIVDSGKPTNLSFIMYGSIPNRANSSYRFQMGYSDAKFFGYEGFRYKLSTATTYLGDKIGGVLGSSVPSNYISGYITNDNLKHSPDGSLNVRYLSIRDPAGNWEHLRVLVKADFSSNPLLVAEAYLTLTSSYINAKCNIKYELSTPVYLSE